VCDLAGDQKTASPFATHMALTTWPCASALASDTHWLFHGSILGETMKEINCTILRCNIAPWFTFDYLLYPSELNEITTRVEQLMIATV
jgi:hypothetical protein